MTELDPEQGEQIHTRTLALLVTPEQLRRLRWRYAHDPEVSADLWTVTEALLNWHAASSKRSKVALTGEPESPSDLTTDQAAEQAEVSVRAIQLAIEEGRLPATKRGGRWWIKPGDLARYASRRAWGGENHAGRGGQPDSCG